MICDEGRMHCGIGEPLIARKICGKKYIDKFFQIRPAFIKDAKARKINETNILAWLLEHDPSYAETSKALGFASPEEELRFMRELVRAVRDSDEIKYHVRILRRDNSPSIEERSAFAHAVGNAIEPEKFTEGNKEHAKLIKQTFLDYDPYGDSDDYGEKGQA